MLRSPQLTLDVPQWAPSLHLQVTWRSIYLAAAGFGEMFLRTRTTLYI